MTLEEPTIKTHSLDSQQIADVRNARGCGVPWPRLSRHYGIPVIELRRLLGEPQWADVPDSQPDQRTLFDDGGAA